MLAQLFIDWLSQEEEPSEFPLCDFERIRYEVRPGDVLLIEGRSRISQVIKQITQSAWSHAALYIGRIHDIESFDARERATKFYQDNSDTQLLIEGILGKGTIVSPLKVYHRDHIRICRPRGLSPVDAQKIINYAVEHLGGGYDMRHIFDTARFLLPWGILPRRFRSTLFEHQAGISTKTVCSTMIAAAFASVDFPILPVIKKHKTKGLELIRRNPKLLTPCDFDYSPYFDIIKYPFIDADQALYRRLPWNREGLISLDGDSIMQTRTDQEPTSATKQSSSSSFPVIGENPFEEPSEQLSKKKKFKIKKDKPVPPPISEEEEDP